MTFVDPRKGGARSVRDWSAILMQLLRRPVYRATLRAYAYLVAKMNQVDSDAAVQDPFRVQIVSKNPETANRTLPASPRKRRPGRRSARLQSINPPPAGPKPLDRVRHEDQGQEIGALRSRRLGPLRSDPRDLRGFWLLTDRVLDSNGASARLAGLMIAFEAAGPRSPVPLRTITDEGWHWLVSVAALLSM
ncbi:hypothetical protein [Kineosporia babensis]|uniref:Uncharacterized protein n=1 Tax=Kineosporia babensis TaxID=499548 RepID=A0A9X1NHC1_9ACTN|nr:hypothetical protein [Kineosporia babensis]MCD5314045.1 hypothetical protein [Kineosporia babensis]